MLEENKMGIEESKDVIEFAELLIDKLIEHKADDGKIDMAEFAFTAVESAPAAVAALVGAGDIPAELKDLSDEERDELIAMALPVLKKLIGMFFELEKKEA